MSGPYNNKFAVKLHDKSECHIEDHSKCCGFSHGPINTASDNVLVEKLGMVRAGDSSTCEKGQTDYIVTGVDGILVNGRLAARTDSRTLHLQGYLEGTASSVLLNGPNAGASFGPDAASLPDCEGAKKTRAPAKYNPTGKASHQGFANNCGTEQARMILNGRKRPNDPYLSEQDMIDIVNKKRAAQGKDKWDPNEGGLSTEDINEVLDEQLKARGQGGSKQVGTKPASEFQSPEKKKYAADHGGFTSPGDLQEQLINGKPVIVPVDGPGFVEDRAGQYQGKFVGGGHVVGVVGVTYGPDGKAQTYVVNDTSIGGGCALPLKASAIDKNLSGEKGAANGRAIVPG